MEAKTCEVEATIVPVWRALRQRSLSKNMTLLLTHLRSAKQYDGIRKLVWK